MTAAEVIARLRVDGHSAFVSAIKSASAAMTGLGHAAQGAKPHLSSIFDTMAGVAGGNLVSGAFSAIAGGAMSAGRAIAGFGIDAVKASVGLEEMRATLIALTGDAATADAKLAFMRKLAIPSRFTFQQLGQAGMLIEGSKLRSEWWLPKIAELAMGTGRNQQYDLQMLGGMAMRMAQGTMPELEAMTHFGLSRKKFADKGVQFGAQGNVLSDARTIVEAFGKIADDYAGVFDTMKNTGAAKFSSLLDMWEQFSAKAGDAILRFIGPAVDKLGEWMQFIVNSGWADKLFGGLANSAAGSGFANIIEAAMSYMLAAGEQFGAILKSAGENFAALFTDAVSGVERIIGRVASGALLVDMDRMTQSRLPDWMFGSGSKNSAMYRLGGIPDRANRSKQEVLDEMMAGANKMQSDWMKANPMGGTAADIASGKRNWLGLDMGQMGARARQIFGEKSSWIAGGGGNTDMPKDTGGPGALSDPLQQIAKNTGRTAQVLERGEQDMKRYVVGGGPIAQQGISAVSIGRAGRRGTIQIQADSGPFGVAFASAVQEAIAQLVRQGVLQVAR